MNRQANASTKFKEVQFNTQCQHNCTTSNFAPTQKTTNAEGSVR